ncbi:LacI family DNA-binding transcriptional regulator [Rathayibacter sp. Leaf296]|uniref:LacI family DNA-binding transcriptional regulator n=1 Tax=Rathayibacter sp. Leaf296 TaxID=1736327 RepID=UPI000702CBF2|nr:LacI family DNA-binding transcriptional regulator [Rathayibacter sp. Leaf296]KQQ08260.1 LacI family transcriptional regulator [Rathayibacter sp. Leaf296]
MSKNATVRLSDVASVAGVSLSTASKALNGSTRISAETRRRVKEAADRLDFRPNALALSFVSGRSRTIGLLTHRAANTFTRPVVIGAVLALGEQQQAVLMLDGDVGAHRAMGESIRQLRDRRIDGVLVIGDGHEHISPSLTHHFDVPVAYAFTASDSAEDVVYLPDNLGAGRLAAQHLLDTGRRRIAHITAEPGSLAVQLREKGFREVLSAAGLEPAGPVRYGAWSREWGASAMAALLESDERPDAVFCGNDHIALGALDVCTARGIGVPGDLALIGVDNWEGVVVDQDVRRVTTIDLELMTLGREAAASLLGPAGEPGEHTVPATLVLGPST